MAANTKNSKSFHDLKIMVMLVVWPDIVLVFIVLLFESPRLAAPSQFWHRRDCPPPESSWRYSLPHTTFNIASFMGLIMVIGTWPSTHPFVSFIQSEVSRRGSPRHHQSVLTAGSPSAPCCDDASPASPARSACTRSRCRIADAPTSRIAVIGGIAISMALSLIITPAVHYYLSHSEGN